MSRELVLINRAQEIDQEAVQHLSAVYHAQSVVWWHCFQLETGVDYSTNIEQNYRWYQNSLEWAVKFADWQKRGWLR
jgi:hypothetical protein